MSNVTIQSLVDELGLEHAVGQVNDANKVVQQIEDALELAECTDIPTYVLERIQESIQHLKDSSKTHVMEACGDFLKTFHGLAEAEEDAKAEVEQEEGVYDLAQDELFDEEDDFGPSTW
jgi:hypothetical protein